MSIPRNPLPSSSNLSTSFSSSLRYLSFLREPLECSGAWKPDFADNCYNSPILAPPGWSVVLLMISPSAFNPSKIHLPNGVALLTSLTSKRIQPRAPFPPLLNLAKSDCQPTSSSKSSSIVSANAFHRCQTSSIVIVTPTSFMPVVLMTGCVLMATFSTSLSAANCIRLVLEVD